MDRKHAQGFGKNMNKLSVIVVRIFVMIIVGLFTVEFSYHTYRLDYDFLSDIIYRFDVSPIKQLLYAIVTIFILYVLQKIVLRGDLENRRKNVKIFGILVSFLTGLLLIVYVTATAISPHWDQLQVYYYAQEFMHGDYSGMQDVYLRIYTQQYGLIFWEEIFLHIWNDYRIFQYMNALLIALIIYMIYLITDVLFERPEISFYSLVGITLFAPIHIMVSYVYGDICSIALSLVGVWALIKFSKVNRARYGVITVFSLTISVLVRKNTLILLIAVGIVCMLYIIKTKNIKFAIWTIAFLSIPLVSPKVIETYYNCVSGFEVDEGLPATAWITMGLSEEEEGCIGIYTGINEAIWNSVSGDNEKVREICAERISGRLSEFSKDKKAALDFFKYKVFEQWGESCLSSINETGKGVAEMDEPTPTVQFVYSVETMDIIYRFMTHHIYLIYIGCFLYTVFYIKKENEIVELILLVAVIGGFLHSIIWEAKGKYVMPYVVFMIPYMAAGIHELLSAGEKIIKRRKQTDV